jgi:hypothetical protein
MDYWYQRDDVEVQRVCKASESGARRSTMKTPLLRLLNRVGLLRPAFRGLERVRSLGAETAVVGPEGLALPPRELRVSVSGNPDPVYFLESGRLARDDIEAALARAGASLSSLGALLDFGCGCGEFCGIGRTSALGSVEAILTTEQSSGVAETCRLPR